MKPRQPDLFDITAARAARDEGMDRVAGNAGDFMSAGLSAILLLPSGEYTGESIRAQLLKRSIVPHHQNAWGALIGLAVRRGVLVGTGRYVSARHVKNHAHHYQVYTKR